MKARPDQSVKRALTSKASSLATLPNRIAVIPATPNWMHAAEVFGRSPSRNSARKPAKMTTHPTRLQMRAQVESAAGRIAATMNSCTNHLDAWHPPAARHVSKRSATDICAELARQSLPPADRALIPARHGGESTSQCVKNELRNAGYPTH